MDKKYIWILDGAGSQDDNASTDFCKGKMVLTKRLAARQ